jgi:phospholipase/carboxylesterase
LPQVEAQPAEAALPPMQAFLAHGRDDTTLGVDWAFRADRWLRARGVSCELHLHDGGHELSSAIQREFRAWFADPDRGWNG